LAGRESKEKVLSPYYVKSWHDNPRIKGSYSSLPVGIDQEALLRELEAPEDDVNPQLFFRWRLRDQTPGFGPQRVPERH